MDDKQENIEPLIGEIRKHKITDKAVSGTVALLNVIPYAGGVVASVIGEIGAQRRIEKICDVLSYLDTKLNEHSIKPENHLSKDQIVEVVYETLQTVSTTSDEKKIAALKNGLSYTFISEDTFERKQLFLQVLRGCTSIELAMLSALYDSFDPYLIQESELSNNIGKENPNHFWTRGLSSIAGIAIGTWEPVSNKTDSNQPTLLTLLTKRVGCDESISEGAIRLLDGKGLSNAVPNLNRNESKVVRWKTQQENIAFLANNSGFANSRVMINPTPFEASHTKFGSDFLRFCKVQ
jgi:hypothetical protein